MKKKKRVKISGEVWVDPPEQQRGSVSSLEDLQELHERACTYQSKPTGNTYPASLT